MAKFLLRLLVVPLALVAPFLVGPPAVDALSTPALPAFCLDANANRWEGLGVGPGVTDDWETDANWSTGQSPLTGDRDVCIPSGGVPVIGAGVESHLTTLDIESGGKLTVDQGGKVFLYGSQSSDVDSVVRSGGRLEVIGGTFGGVSKLHVLGTMVLKSVPPTASTTVTVRDCAYDTSPGPSYPGEEACLPPMPGPPKTAPLTGPHGLIEIADAGTLDVQGGGINLGDGFGIITRGLMRVRSGAYVAADHGTRLELRPHLTATPGAGILRFEGDGGYLEGKIQSDNGIAALSTLVNQGSIQKTGGGGRTLISAVYSQPAPGKVSVSTGQLLLPTGPVTPAFVDGGVVYGTARCVLSQTTTCPTSTFTGFQQSAVFKVPFADTSGANVVVRKLASRSSVDLGFPFEVHATGLAATAGRPAIITLRFDATVLRGKRWATVRILRKSGASAYAPVRACTSTGRPPGTAKSCVDRRGLAGSSRNVANASGAPDVIMVIRTIRTSRWVGR